MILVQKKATPLPKLLTQSQIPCTSEQTCLMNLNPIYVKVSALTSMTSSAGRMPMFDNVLKKASLFWGCNVCENAQNSFRKFTYKEEINTALWNKGQGEKWVNSIW